MKKFIQDSELKNNLQVFKLANDHYSPYIYLDHLSGNNVSNKFKFVSNISRDMEKYFKTDDKLTFYYSINNLIELVKTKKYKTFFKQIVYLIIEVLNEIDSKRKLNNRSNCISYTSTTTKLKKLYNCNLNDLINKVNSMYVIGNKISYNVYSKISIILECLHKENIFYEQTNIDNNILCCEIYYKKLNSNFNYTKEKDILSNCYVIIDHLKDLYKAYDFIKYSLNYK